MTGTLIATADDLATYLNVQDIDLNRAWQLLTLAQDKCEGILSPLPTAALGVVLDIAGRAYTNPSNAQSGPVLPFGQSQNATSIGGLWMTRANIAELRRLGAGAAAGAFSIDPTPADAGPSNVWGQVPLQPGDVWTSPPFYGDWDYPST